MKLLNDGLMRVAVASIAVIMTVGVAVLMFVIFTGGRIVWG